MAKKSKKPVDTGFLMVNVFYEDGSRSSNRRVPREAISVLDADADIRAAIEAQDREIAERSGQPRGPVKRIERV